MPKVGGYSEFSGKDAGFGILWNRAVYETIVSNGVIIQTSFPKGGPYVDPNGQSFGYCVFATRVTNATATPFELTISFPSDPFIVPDSYFKLFLPPDTMTLPKVMLYDYGATGLKSFLDAGLHTPTMLQRTLNPNEECFFYIGVLFPHAYGVARAALVVKEQDIFYRISGIARDLDSAMIPCGRIVVKK